MVVKNYINKAMLVALLVLLLSPFTLSTISAEGEGLSNNSLVEDGEELEDTENSEDENSEDTEGTEGTEDETSETDGTEVSNSEEYDVEESSDGSISASKTSINPLLLGVAIVSILGIVGVLFFGDKKK